MPEQDRRSRGEVHIASAAEKAFQELSTVAGGLIEANLENVTELPIDNRIIRVESAEPQFDSRSGETIRLQRSSWRDRKESPIPPDAYIYSISVEGPIVPRGHSSSEGYDWRNNKPPSTYRTLPKYHDKISERHATEADAVEAGRRLEQYGDTAAKRKKAQIVRLRDALASRAIELGYTN